MRALVDRCTELENDFADYDKRPGTKDNKDNKKAGNAGGSNTGGGGGQGSGDGGGGGEDSGKQPWSARPEAFKNLQPLNQEIFDRCKCYNLCSKCEKPTLCNEYVGQCFDSSVRNKDGLTM